MAHAPPNGNTLFPLTDALGGNPPVTARIRTIVHRRQKDFDALFHEQPFTSMRAVSYVATPGLLLEWLTKHTFETLEVIVGDNLAQQYRHDLRARHTLIEELTALLDRGALRIFIPKHTLTMHTKLYILRGHNRARVIQSSANFTETARKAAQQINYTWVIDLPLDDPFLAQIDQDYARHMDDCVLFLDDLRALFERHPREAKQTIIDRWLRSGQVSDEHQAFRTFMREVREQALETHVDGATLLRVRLPDAPKARAQAEKFMAPLKPGKLEQTLHMPRPALLRYVQAQAMPLMVVDRERQQVRLGLDDEVLVLTAPLPEPPAVQKALSHLEAYVNTVDWGECLDTLYAKTSMYEAILYVLAAPFTHDYMRAKVSSYGLVETPRARVLYIVGPSYNGKSTFLKFALKLITGHWIEPLPGSAFTKRKLQGLHDIGSVFPLLFDDVQPGKSKASFEENVKSYWEVWWQPETPAPQIIMTSNYQILEEWGKSRCKRVDFDVHFAPTEAQKVKLQAILAQHNPVFTWFSALYFEQMAEHVLPHNDELALARAVMQALYAHAERALPAYFPSQPIEAMYDQGRRAWRDLLYGLGKARITQDIQRLRIEFDADIQRGDVNKYIGLLPQTVKHKRLGNTLVIESPGLFTEWMGEEMVRAERKSWWTRLIRR